MKKVNYIKLLITALMLVILVGCTNIEDSISEEESKQLVLKQHRKHIGTPSIVSIEVKNNAYYVRCENGESGKDKVAKDGEVEMVEVQIE
jgi:hypothetical protein